MAARHEYEHPLSVLSENQQELLHRFNTRETMADIINSILEEHDLKSQELALILDVSKSNITRWGEDQRIRDINLNRLVTVFPEVSFERLYRAMESRENWLLHEAQLMGMTPAETDPVLRYQELEGIYEPRYMVDRFDPFRSR